MSRAYKSQQVRQFKFWLNQTLNEGMQYEFALYQRICALGYAQRQQLYQKAAQLAHNGADVIITHNDRDCYLWLNLKSKSLSISVSTQALIHKLPEIPTSDMAPLSPWPISE